MNRLFLLISFLIFCFIISSCKQTVEKSDLNSNKSTKSEYSKVDKYTSDSDIPKGVRVVKNMPDKYSPKQIEGMNRDALRILEFRNNEKGRKYWDVLTNGVWEYQYIFGGIEKTKPDELNGRWIKFEENMVYSYGFFENIQGKGTYHYDLESAQLLLVDDNIKIKPNEYIVQMFTNIAILKGTSTYYDNNFQCKIKGVGIIPTKSSNVTSMTQ